MSCKYVALAALIIAAASVLCVGENKSEVKGMIKSRTGDTLLVQSGGSNVTVVLTADTRTKDNTGLFGLGTDEMSDVILIPGLKVDIDGVPDQGGRVVATTITVDGDDLETAEMVQAGLHPTAEQVAANVDAIAANRQRTEEHGVQLASQKESIAANKEQIQANMKDIEENTERFETLNDYDVKGQATVKFGFGSSEISDKDKEQLKTLAQSASRVDGYILEVTGYADSTGNPAVNTKLSETRAKAVVQFLFQQCSIPMRHMVAPGAMGEYGSAAPNETRAGRAENRRVEVKVLVNKGIAGS